MVKRTRWVLGVVGILALSGCTMSSGNAPASISLQSTASATPSVVDPSTYLSATPSAIDPSELGPPSSDGVATSSGGVSLAPLPAGLTADQIADAKAAVEVYRAYWSVSDQALADPTNDWAQQIAAVADGTAGDLLLNDIHSLANAGRHTTGRTVIDATVIKVEPANVHLVGCVDVSGTDVVDANGQSVKVPDGPGTYERFQTATQVGQVQGGAWLVAVDTFDRDSTC